MKILVINAGSSSVKFSLFDMPSENVLCAGLVERIGTDQSLIRCKVESSHHKKNIEKKEPVTDHTAALKEVLELLVDADNGIIKNISEITIIGHRVVHGGEDFKQATLITEKTKEKIKQLFTLAPLHNPVNYRCIEVAEKKFPAAKQVAVFDTAFHQSMPPKAYRYAIPVTYYTNEQIRAYGFHGTSHKYVSTKAREYLKKSDAKIISVHLGNGCSIAAINGEQSLDTSMGFGPLSGLVMGTRSGDIDPSVIFHMIDKLGLNEERINTLLNKQSGLLGLCGFGDMRDIRKAIEYGNKEALFACELYAYRIKKYIGAYIAALNGLDALIFTAGVGENDSYIRQLVCSNLEFVNIHLDVEANQQKEDGVLEINIPASSVKILIIPTNEELEIARQCFNLISV